MVTRARVGLRSRRVPRPLPRLSAPTPRTHGNGTYSSALSAFFVAK